MPQVTWVAAVLVLFGGTSALAAGTSRQARASTQPPARSMLPGTWLGQYSGAFSGTFTLKWKLKQSRLSGTITLSNPKGQYGITGSVTKKGAIKFGAVQVGAVYTGTVKGKSMSGTYQTPQGGGSWSATKKS